MEFLGENAIPFCIVFTKADKLKLNQLNKNIEVYKKQLISIIWEEMLPYFSISATEGSGKDDILDFIDDLNSNMIENS